MASRLRETPGKLCALAWSMESPELSREVEDRYAALHRHCADQLSRLRLGRLLHRLSHQDPGVQESALAELELAAQLIRVGSRVTFLPESQARTPDLECHLGHERFFVEVTAMVRSSERSQPSRRHLLVEEGQEQEEDRGAILIHRILARIVQKAKQVVGHCDLVILSMSIPRGDLLGARLREREEIRLDLKHLAGAVTLLVQKLPQLSAVLIALWDVTPFPARAATRLANVVLAERTRQQKGFPRVRLLIENPRATTLLSEREREAFRQLL